MRYLSCHICHHERRRSRDVCSWRRGAQFSADKCVRLTPCGMCGRVRKLKRNN